MKRISRKIFILFILMNLIGCGIFHDKRDIWFRDRSSDYLSAKVVEPLTMPDGIVAPPPSNHYPLPDHVPDRELADLNLEPPGFGKSL